MYMTMDIPVPIRVVPVRLQGVNTAGTGTADEPDLAHVPFQVGGFLFTPEVAD